MANEPPVCDKQTGGLLFSPPPQGGRERDGSRCGEDAIARDAHLLPLWEKVARTQSAPDEGYVSAATDPSPGSLARATLSHKGRGY